MNGRRRRGRRPRGASRGAWGVVSGLALLGWVAGCRPTPVPEGAVVSGGVDAPATPPGPAPTPSASASQRPGPERRGSTCQVLDAKGTAAAARLLGAPAGAEVIGGHCAEGETLEQLTVLEPGAQVTVKVLALAPLARVQAVLEAHPDVSAQPLAAGAGDVPSTGPLVLVLPGGGSALPAQPAATPARLTVTAERGVGTLAAYVSRR